MVSFSFYYTPETHKLDIFLWQKDVFSLEGTKSYLNLKIRPTLIYIGRAGQNRTSPRPAFFFLDRSKFFSVGMEVEI